MTARWPKDKPVPKARSPRGPVLRGRFRCCGVGGCGEVIEGTWASAERHADEHHGARLEAIIEEGT